MTSLLQISDPHFGTEVPPVVDALLALSEELRPSLVVISGDVTQRATTTQFRAARSFFDALTADARFAVPGNHDIPLLNLPLRLLSPFARFRAAFGPDLEPLYDDGSMRVIGVNTVVPTLHKDGAARPDGIERAQARLAGSDASQLRVVVCHHPVLAIRPEDIGNVLHDAATAVPRWVAAGADLIIGGHIHLPYVRPLAEAFPGLPRRAWSVQAGTAVSSRTRGDLSNSVMLIRTERDEGRLGCAIERWDYRAASRRFERASVERISPDRAAADPRTGPAADPRS